ncbi:hypothetical protein OG994_16650 [Micromonospora globbae]|uniref:Uncharacterized protein n=1 Tax=Micromonospora globbae TaxID=1894969 RepID=A0ABZ1S159_9ACTN|nr:hypothetical protein [Micromonospora globbae]
MTETPTQNEVRRGFVPWGLVNDLLQSLGLEANRVVRVEIDHMSIRATVLKEDRPKGQYPTEDHVFWISRKRK